MKTFEKNSSLTQFITPECELDKIAAPECVPVRHGVKYEHSYRLQGTFIHCIVLFFALYTLKIEYKSTNIP